MGKKERTRRWRNGKPASRDARSVDRRDRELLVVLKPITPLGMLLLFVSAVLGGLSIVPTLLWAMASENASRHPHGDVWIEFWKLAFPNPIVGTFLTIFTLMSALVAAAGTFMLLRQWGNRHALLELGLRSAVGFAASGASSSSGSSSMSGGGSFGGGGATGSW